MLLTQTVPPPEEPISVDDLKTHMRVDGTDEDNYIEALGIAAREYAEMFTGRQIVTATYRYDLPDFPDGRIIRLPKPPLASVDSVYYYATDETLTELTAATYYNVFTGDEPGYIELAYGQSWPSTYARADAVQITYKAGYGVAETIPKAILSAIQLLTSQWFEHREPTIVGTIIAKVPHTVEALLWAHRAAEVR